MTRLVIEMYALAGALLWGTPLPARRELQGERGLSQSTETVLLLAGAAALAATVVAVVTGYVVARLPK